MSLALCVFDAERNGSAIRILPAGEFRARDGRPQGVDAWRLDKAHAERLIAAAHARRVDYPVDYEHQTLLTEKNGQPAPAAGWFRALEWREDGLWATDVRWTARAREMLDAGEYRYLSPVFSYDGGTGHVASLHSVALTNNPALDDLDDLYVRAAARFGAADHSEDDTMHPELLKLLQRFGLPAEHSDEQVAAAVAALSTQLGKLDQVEAQIAALRERTPDPAQYAPVAVVETLKTQLAALTTQIRDREIDEVVSEGLDSGRLLPAQEAWARELAAKDIASLRTYLESAAPIAALRGTQTGGEEPRGDGGPTLSATELAVCRNLGLEPDKFRENLTRH